MRKTSAKVGRPKSAKRLRAEQNYREQGYSNAELASRRAGYAESTARARGGEIVADVRFELQEQARQQGFGPDRVIRKTIALTEAKKAGWNRKKEKWESFTDNDVQLRATNRLAEYLGFAPPEEAGGDTRPVQIIFPNSFANLVKVEAPHGEERRNQ